MAQKETAHAFVLRVVQYAERDLIVTLFTREHGLCSAIAKNARSSKRFGGGLHLFRQLRVILQPKAQQGMYLLLEGSVEAHYPGLEKAYDKIVVGSYATELLRELCEGEVESEAIFELLGDFYTQLDTLPARPQALEALLHHFELQVLANFGVLPSLYQCHRCGTAFDKLSALQCKRTGEGLLCEGCKKPGEAVGSIEPGTLDALHYYMRPQGPPPGALGDEHSRQQARRLIQHSFRLILQKDLKSRAMLEGVLV